MRCLSLKMCNGHEWLGLTTYHKVEFGIKEYKGKIPRKIFKILKDVDSEEERSHFLILFKVIQVIPINDGNSSRLMSIFTTGPNGLSSIHPMDMTVHSNDVIAISSAIDIDVEMGYRKFAGVLNQENIPANIFSTKHQ